MISINQIFQALPDVATVFRGCVRVVGVDPYGQAILMSLDVLPLKAPFACPLDLLQEAIEAGEVVTLPYFDQGLPFSRSLLSKKAQEKMDNDFGLLRSLLENDEVLYSPILRGEEFRRIANEANVCLRTVRRLYYNYLADGQTVLALAPAFGKRGGVGRPQREGTQRRGRKATDRETASLVALPDVRKNLEVGARLYFFPGEYTLKLALVKTWKRSFFDPVKVEQFGWDAELDDILVEKANRPTERQFKYVIECMERQGWKRKGKPRQVRKTEPVRLYHGKAREGVLGPGYRFEFDPSRYQVKVVSQFDRANCVGDATWCIAVDVFSGAITGYAVSLGRESWSLAEKALENCFSDKQKVFDKLGLPYESSKDWPCCHLPQRLAADRGVLASDKASVVPDLGIIVEIMPPMRGDRKPIVEAKINEVKHGHFYPIPGSHPKFPKRRESDGTESAALTLEELERVLVEIIIDLNNEPVPIDDIPISMVEQGCKDITHIGLYRWGLENRAGHTRTLPAKEVFTHLMLKGQAKVTEKGLVFQNQTFKCRELIEHGYLSRAADEGNYDIEVRYQDDADLIWYLDEVDNDWIPAENTDEEIRRLKAGFVELENLRKEKKKLWNKAKYENAHRIDEKSERLGEQIRSAQKEARAAKGGIPRTKNKDKIRLNLAVEKEAERIKAEGETLASFASGEMNARAAARSGSNKALSEENGGSVESLNKAVSQRSLELWRDPDSPNASKGQLERKIDGEEEEKKTLTQRSRDLWRTPDG